MKFKKITKKLKYFKIFSTKWNWYNGIYQLFLIFLLKLSQKWINKLNE